MAFRETLDTVNNILTLPELRSYLGSTSTGEDTTYKRVINNVSSRFNTYCDRKFKARNCTEYYDGDNSTRLWVRTYPINSNATSIDIRIDTDRTFSTSDKVSSSSIIIYSDMGKIVLDDDSFDAGRQSVKVSYNGGYTVSSTSSTGSTGTMPSDLRYAAMEMCRFYLNREKDNRVGIRNFAAEGASVSYETDMPWSVKQVLDLYRNMYRG